MSEIETVPEKAPVVDHHKTESSYSNSDEKAYSSREHIDTNPAPETEESSEVYDPNVYAGASRPSPTPH